MGSSHVGKENLDHILVCGYSFILMFTYPMGSATVCGGQEGRRKKQQPRETWQQGVTVKPEVDGGGGFNKRQSPSLSKRMAVPCEGCLSLDLDVSSVTHMERYGGGELRRWTN